MPEETIPVFVYGTLRKNSFVKYRELDLERFARKIAEIKADLHALRGASFPAVINVDASDGTVKGEIIYVDQETLDRLDVIEGAISSDGLYKRIPATTTDGEVVQVYALNRIEFIGEKINHGDFQQFVVSMKLIAIALDDANDLSHDTIRAFIPDLGRIVEVPVK